MEIHIRLAGIQLGPYSENQVRRYLAEGLLSPSDPAKLESMENWVAVSAVLASLPLAAARATALETLPKSGPLPSLKSGPLPKVSGEVSSSTSPGTDYAPSTSRETKKVAIASLIKSVPKKTGPLGPAPSSVRLPVVSPSSPEPATTYLPPKPQETKRVNVVLPPFSPPPFSPPPETPPAEKSVPSTPLVSVPRPASVKASSPNPMAPSLPRSPRETARMALPMLVKALSQNTMPLSMPAPVALPPATTRSGPLPTRALPQKAREANRAALPSLVKALAQNNAPAAPAVPAEPPAPSPAVPSTPMPSPPAKSIPPERTSRPRTQALSPPEIKALTQRLGRVSLAEFMSPAAAPSVPATPAARMAPEPELVALSVEMEPAPVAPAPVAVAEPSAFPREAALAPTPSRPRRRPRGVIYVCAGLVLVLGGVAAYVWSSYHAADSLLKAFHEGDPAQLENGVDFPAVRASLKEQVKAQLAKSGIQEGNSQAGPASGSVLSMIDNSIDLYVTPSGISALMNKSGNFAKTGQAPVISPEAAGKILLGWSNQSMKSQGLDSPGDFVIESDAAWLHLQFYGPGWKLNRIDLKSDFQLPSLPSSSAPPASSTENVSPLIAPVIETYLAEGKAKFDQSDWNGAIADFTQVLAINPKATVAYSNRGAARGANGDLEGAIADYTQALGLDPKLAPAYYGRGKAKAANGDMDGAVADYTAALEFDPKLFDAYFRRGDAKAAKNDWDGAIADFTQAITLDPTEAGPYNNRGYAQQAKGDLDGAIADYTQALAINPKIAGAYYNRGLARQSQGNFDAAILDFDQAIDLDPKKPGAYYNRGNAKNSKQDLDGAIADYTQALALDPKIALAYCNRGRARQAKGDLDGAIADYTQALAIDPKIAVAYYNRGLIKQQRNDLDGAIADSSQALDLDAKNAQAYYNRGLAKLSKGNLDGAVADLRQFCAIAPKDHYADNAHLYLWLIARAQNAKTDPDPELSEALLNGWNSSPDDLLSKIAGFLLDRVSEADLIAAASSPDAKKDQGQHCEVWYFAGMKRLLSGDKPTAIDYFHKCLATGQRDYCEYILAEAELQALEPASKT